MPTIRVVDLQGDLKELPIEEGLSLMEHLVEEGYEEVQAICGGSCSCATCHVFISNMPEGQSDIEEDELMLLEMADGYDKKRSRLSCQLELDRSHDGLEVVLVAGGF